MDSLGFEITHKSHIIIIIITVFQHMSVSGSALQIYNANF